MTLLKLAGGTIHDPANSIDGDVRDLWIRNGTIVEPPTSDEHFNSVDCRGLVVMPGGIDMHAHIAGPKVNIARKLRPEERREKPFERTSMLRSGTLGSTPSTFVTGYLYAGMGYTTVFDAAIPPLGARHTHEEFHDTPVIDKGFFTLVGNNHYVLQQIAKNEPERLDHFLAWLLNATKSYALKVVNPGGVEAWKSGNNDMVGLDDAIADYGVSPRQIVRCIAQAGNRLKLPHPIHIHCNRLGMPGNWQTTLATMRAVEEEHAHFTHIQFHSYGGGPDDQDTFCSKTQPLAEYVNTHPNITVDVGQVMFGETTSMTGDGPLGYYLRKVTGRKWFNGDTECEAGCGIVPITYKDKSLIHALQWSIGLEWFLLVKNPWQIAMSTDHPNGGAFTAYPEIIALLMSRDRRRELLKRLPERVRERCLLPELDREYTLNEIAIITRAAPARMLGLTTKGQLGIGADADVTVYTQAQDVQAMFELPRFVYKAGELVVDRGEIRKVPYGPTWHVEPAYDPTTLNDVKLWFEEHYSIAWANYPVDDFYLSHGKRSPPHPSPPPQGRGSKS